MIKYFAAASAAIAAVPAHADEFFAVTPSGATEMLFAEPPKLICDRHLYIMMLDEKVNSELIVHCDVVFLMRYSCLWCPPDGKIDDGLSPSITYTKSVWNIHETHPKSKTKKG